MRLEKSGRWEEFWERQQIILIFIHSLTNIYWVITLCHVLFCALEYGREKNKYFCSCSAYSLLLTAKSLQSCPTLCDPMDGSPLGSPVPGILKARGLEWVAISFSSAWKWEVKVKSLSRVRLLVTPWTAAHQAPPSMGFSRQEYWSGVPLHSLAMYWGGS